MIETILASSVLILILIALRYSLRGRISLRLQYGLWGIAALRLILPFSLFRSPLSIMNAVNRNAAANEVTGYFLNGLHNTDLRVEPIAADITNPAAPTIQAGGQGISTISSMQPPISLRETLMIVWLAGMVIVAAWLIITNLMLKQRLRSTDPCREIKCALPIYRADWLPSPCLFGLFRPAIYLNAAVYENKHVLDHVLAHELCHHSHRDQLWSIVRGLCLILHWYNPLVWVAAALSKRDCELACDEASIKKLGEAERIPYGMTLLALVQQRTAPAQLASIATTMTGGKRSLKERIMLIAEKPKSLTAVAAGLALVMVLAVGCTFTGPKKEQSYAQTLLAHKTAYVGNNSKVGDLLEALHFPDSWERDGFELKTEERPYRLTVKFKANSEIAGASDYTQKVAPQASSVALMLFALIENVDEIIFFLPGSDGDLNIGYNREWMDGWVKEDIRNYADTPEHLEKLLSIRLPDMVPSPPSTLETPDTTPSVSPIEQKAYFGKFNITEEAASGVSTYSQADVDKMIGKTLSFSSDEAVIINDQPSASPVEIKSPQYSESTLTANNFQSAFKVSAEKLGLSSGDIIEIDISDPSGAASGCTLIMQGDKVVIVAGGVYFALERIA